MSFRRSYLDQNRTRRNSGPLTARLLRATALILWLGVTILAVTFFGPKTSGIRSSSSLSIVSPTPIPSQSTIQAPTEQRQPDLVPLLAYYYIWFDTRSWDRAKKDYPLLGKYSSDDAAVMRQHIRWAKEAGIDGFIVSWKSTEKLNRRLHQLVRVADQENFKLAIIYEGLGFDRNPLSVEQVDADLQYFIETYAGERVFRIFEKPMVIWSGTWKFSLEDIQSVVQDSGEDIHILASEKNVEDYRRVAHLVDGDAYYWSSVNPETHPGYAEKLMEMGGAVHQHGGIWIAPAAPGYDSQLLGGTTVVDRKSGETLRTQLEAALQSGPDAIGIISWNEFSENSHIEPSHSYGRQALDVLAGAQSMLSRPK